MQHEIEQIKVRLTALEQLNGVRPARQIDGKPKPVNRIAYEKALSAHFGGSRTALNDYVKLYRIPT